MFCIGLQYVHTLMKFPGGFFQENNQLVGQHLIFTHFPHQRIGKRDPAPGALISFTECRQHRRTVPEYQVASIPQYFTKPGAGNKLVINLAVIVNFPISHSITQKNPAINAYRSP